MDPPQESAVSEGEGVALLGVISLDDEIAVLDHPPEANMLGFVPALLS